jgi:hypothetical protein
LTAGAPAVQTGRMPRLFRLDTEANIGVISPAQLKFLVEQLEEEHDDDQDYYIDRDTLELLADNGIDDELLAMLEKALGDDDAMDIAWDDEGK